MSRVEIWYVRTEDVTGDALLDACDRIASEDERERGRNLRFPRDRHEHLVTRALLRGVLARELGVRPAGLAFHRDEYGRPWLDRPCEVGFNLTNTTELVACAVVRGAAVGLDAEPLGHADRVLEVMHQVFTSSEKAALDALDEPARREQAVRLWTAKEAYIKARGLGLTLPPDSFEIDLRAEQASLHFLSDLGDDPTRWQIETREIERHSVALCVERAAAGRRDVVPRRADPSLLLELVTR